MIELLERPCSYCDAPLGSEHGRASWMASGPSPYAPLIGGISGRRTVVVMVPVGSRRARGSPGDASRRAKGLRRARKFNVRSEPITRLTVLERDNWTCRICGGPIDPARRWPEEDSPSLDHIIPLVLGGPHTMDNIQAAHLVCNLRKSTKKAPIAFESQESHNA